MNGTTTAWALTDQPSVGVGETIANPPYDKCSGQNEKHPTDEIRKRDPVCKIRQARRNYFRLVTEGFNNPKEGFSQRNSDLILLHKKKDAEKSD